MALTDAFLRAVGRVTVNFSTLELHMDFGIAGLIGPDQGVGQIVAAELSFRLKCSMLASLFRHKVSVAKREDAEPCIEKLEGLLKRLTQLEDKRNQITHSAWLVSEGEVLDQATRLKITAKQKGLRHQSETITAETLNALADDIATVAKEIVPLLMSCLENRNPYEAA